MKKSKLNLNELKVKSFVTDLENGKENTVKGGHDCDPTHTCPPTNNCPGNPGGLTGGGTELAYGGVGCCLDSGPVECPANY